MDGGCPRAALSQRRREGEGGHGWEADEAGLRAAVPAAGSTGVNGPRGASLGARGGWGELGRLSRGLAAPTPRPPGPVLGSCWLTRSRLCCQIRLHRQQEPSGPPSRARAPVRGAGRSPAFAPSASPGCLAWPRRHQVLGRRLAWTRPGRPGCCVSKVRGGGEWCVGAGGPFSHLRSPRQ